MTGETQIQVVPELGTIIIRGAKADVNRVMGAIKQIEERDEEDGEEDEEEDDDASVGG